MNRMKELRNLGLIGFLNESGVTSKNYKKKIVEMVIKKHKRDKVDGYLPEKQSR